MKNTKRSSSDNQDHAAQKLRTAALRALNTTHLKAVKGGDGTPPPGIDPIC